MVSYKVYGKKFNGTKHIEFVEGTCEEEARTVAENTLLNLINMDVLKSGSFKRN